MLKDQKGIAHLLLIVLVLAGIGIGLYLIKNPAIFRPRADSTDSYIQAYPNPCILDEKGLCTAKITWNAADIPNVRITIKESPGSLFAQASTGSQDAPWITASGATFEMYSGDSNTPFASLVVKGVSKDSLTADAMSPATPDVPNPSNAKPNEVIIKYRDGQSPKELASQTSDQAVQNGQMSAQQKLSQLYTIETQVGVSERRILIQDTTISGLKNMELIRARASVADLMDRYRALPEVEWVQPNYISEANDLIPNDTYYGQQWHMKKVGMEQAWSQAEGDPNILIAVVDSGVDPNNADLANRVILGPNYSSDGNPTQAIDNQGHGTFVSSIIAAAVNNGYGFAGIVRNPKLLEIKVFDSTNSTNDDQLVPAFNYALTHGAKVINYSGGHSGSSGSCGNNPALQTVLDAIDQAGILFVQSAGNNSTDASGSISSCTKSFAVGATTTTDARAPYSNYGSMVQISAPGGSAPSGVTCANSPSGCIASWWPNGVLHYGTGTSYAAPMVTGAAALLLSKNPALTLNQLKYYLTEGADPIATDQPIGKRLNVTKSLALLSPTSPSPSPSPSPTPNPTLDPALCTPRPNIVRTSRMTGDGLLVTLTPGLNANVTSNPITKVEFTNFVNGTATINNTVYNSSNNIYSIPSGTNSVQILIKQVTYGQATNINMKAYDGCGPYSLFFGAGTGANWPH